MKGRRRGGGERRQKGVEEGGEEGGKKGIEREVGGGSQREMEITLQDSLSGTFLGKRMS